MNNEMMKSWFLDKETRKVIEQQMPRAIRKRYKDGNKIVVRIHHESDLIRWCKDHYNPENDCIIKITKNGRLLTNNLVDRASAASYGKFGEAWCQARTAISYFIYGDYYWDFTISYEMG